MPRFLGAWQVSMGCASSKDADAGSDKAKDYRSEDTAKPEDVKVQSEPSVKMNAAGRRVSKTVRRIAVRYASEDAPNSPTWEGNRGWVPSARMRGTPRDVPRLSSYARGLHAGPRRTKT